MKSSKVIKRTLLLVGLGLLVCIAGSIAFIVASKQSEYNIPSTDTQRIYDLQALEVGIMKSYNQPTDGEPSHLPTSLNDITHSELYGRLEEYDYSVVQQYNGGPTVIYKICTTFQKAGKKTDSKSSTYNSSEGYNYHGKGKQCFENSYYKGESHIRPL